MMNAFDFCKIADKVNFRMKKKIMGKTNRKTSRFLKFILRHIKMRAKKGYYFLNISRDIDFIDYPFICNKLEELKFNIDYSFSSIYSIKWISNH